VNGLHEIYDYLVAEIGFWLQHDRFTGTLMSRSLHHIRVNGECNELYGAAPGCPNLLPRAQTNASWRHQQTPGLAFRPPLSEVRVTNTYSHQVTDESTGRQFAPRQGVFFQENPIQRTGTTRQNWLGASSRMGLTIAQYLNAVIQHRPLSSRHHVACLHIRHRASDSFATF